MYKTLAATQYMTDSIMPTNRKSGCACPYDQEQYRLGRFSHEKDCTSPMLENLPSAPRLLAALLQGQGAR